MKKNAYGVFEITVPAKGGEKAIPHNSKVKVLLSNILEQSINASANY